MSSISSCSPKINSLLVGLALVLAVGQLSGVESKFLRPMPYNYGPDFGGYPEESVRTGERAIVTIRGARHPIDGHPPRRLALEAGPYPGGYPRRGVYDNLDGYGPPRWGGDLVPVGPYEPLGLDRPAFYRDEAPARIAVTGVYPAGGGGGFRGRY